MVSVYVNLGGEFDKDRSDVTTFTRSSPEVLAMLALGEYLATGGTFIVKKIRWYPDFDQGYMKVTWTCVVGDDFNFVMHLTLAKWDPLYWLTHATFGVDNSFAFAALRSNLEAWEIQTSPELMSIDQMQMRVILGTPTRSGRWRVIMKMQNNALATRLRQLRNQLEHVLSVSFFNMSGELHFSLDRWWGPFPHFFCIRPEMILKGCPWI